MNGLNVDLIDNGSPDPFTIICDEPELNEMNISNMPQTEANASLDRIKSAEETFAGLVNKQKNQQAPLKQGLSSATHTGTSNLINPKNITPKNPQEMSGRNTSAPLSSKDSLNIPNEIKKKMAPQKVMVDQEQLYIDSTRKLWRMEEKLKRYDKNVKKNNKPVIVIDEEENKLSDHQRVKNRPKFELPPKKNTMEVISLDDEDEVTTSKVPEKPAKNAGTGSNTLSARLEEFKKTATAAVRNESVKAAPTQGPEAIKHSAPPLERPQEFDPTLLTQRFPENLRGLPPDSLYSRGLFGASPYSNPNSLNFFQAMAMARMYPLAQMMMDPSLSMLNAMGMNPLLRSSRPMMNPAALNPEFLALNSQFQRKFDLPNNFSYRDLLTQRAANAQEREREAELVFSNRVVREESSEDYNRAISKERSKGPDSLEKDSSAHTVQQTPTQKKSKITIPKVTIEKPKPQPQPIAKPQIFQIKRRKKPSPIQNDRIEVESSAEPSGIVKETEETTSTKISPEEATSQLEENLPKEVRKGVRGRKPKQQQQPALTPVMSSFYNDKLFKPRRRNKMQIIAEERDKLLQQWKELGKKIGEEEGVGGGADEVGLMSDGGKTSKPASSNKVKIGKNHQAVVPEFRPRKAEPTRRFKNVWKPTDIKEEEFENYAEAVELVLDTEWCRQDFLARFLRLNKLDSQMALDVINSNKEYFSNLVSSKQIASVFSQVTAENGKR